MTVATELLNQAYTIKEGDRLPVIEIAALDEDGLPLDLTGFTGVIIIAACAGGRRIVDEAEVTIDADPTTGLMSYAWGVGETDKPGEYLMEVRLSKWVGPTLKTMTIPGAGYAKVTITPQL